jgi:hypothetical protein
VPVAKLSAHIYLDALYSTVWGRLFAPGTGAVLKVNVPEEAVRAGDRTS